MEWRIRNLHAVKMHRPPTQPGEYPLAVSEPHVQKHLQPVALSAFTLCLGKCTLPCIGRRLLSVPEIILVRCYGGIRGMRNFLRK